MSGRALVAHLPAFRLERIGYGAEDVAGLIDASHGAMRLVSLTPAGVVAGLRVGMTASEARAHHPGVPLETLDPGAEEQDHLALLRAFDAVSDRVSSPWPDEVVLDVTHIGRLHGGETETAERALALITTLGHVGRIAVADDPLAAAALAVWATPDGGVTLAPPGGSAALLAPLPIEALRPDATLVVALRAIGIERVGAFAALDPASVVGRYGAAAGRLHHVARGLGAAVVQLPASGVLQDLPSVRIPLAGATTLAELQFVLPSLIGALSERLADRDLAVVRLRVLLRLESTSKLGASPVSSVGIRVGRPTRAPETLERLIRTRIDRLEIAAPAEELCLEAIEAVPEVGWQPGLSDRSEATEPLPDLLARLEDHLGADALFSVCPADAWRPEVAWCRAPFPPARIRPADPGPEAALRSDDPLEVQEAFEHGLPTPRPALLLPAPQRIEVLGAPAPQVVGLQGRRFSVQQARGPEHLAGGWWDPSEAFDRRYWVVQIDERVAWIFHASGVWYLHGWFD